MGPAADCWEDEPPRTERRERVAERAAGPAACRLLAGVASAPPLVADGPLPRMAGAN